MLVVFVFAGGVAVKYISICSGIEAATVAWHGMGWQPLAFSEIEPFPSAVLGHHYPDVPNLGDMTDYLSWPEELLLECELLVGGTPCQAFSVAGKRESLGDERGNLSLVFCNLYHHINEIRRRHGRPPAIVVWENVPGVLSTKDNAFGCFLAGIMGLDEAVETESGKWHKAGFLSGETIRVGYRIIDAQYFGVAQRRRRVFLVAVPCELVASLGERACPSEILSLRESVLGDPPTRGAAWEGVARTTAASLTSSGRGVERCGESRGQDDVVLDPAAVAGQCFPTVDANIDSKWGSNQWVDSGQAIMHPSVAKTLTQRMHKGFDSTLDSQTPIVAFHPTQDPISAADGSTHSMGCGPKQGCCTQAVAFQSNLGTRGGDVYEDGTTPTVRVGSGVGVPSPPAVAFKPSHYTRGKDGKPSEVAAPLSADADKGDQDTVIAFTQNTRDEVRQINGDGKIAGALAANSGMKQTNYLAFKESQSGCRLGDVHATIDANKGSRRVEGVVAIQERAICENPNAGPDGAGVRDDGVSYTLESRTVTQAVAFAQNQLGEVRTNRDVMGTVNTNQNASGRNTPMVQQAMQVRRLTPTECERLQGFPDRYTDVTYRNKPAADGPRYKALGNSMAVPCMAWIGYRIEKATRH